MSMLNSLLSTKIFKIINVTKKSLLLILIFSFSGCNFYRGKCMQQNTQSAPIPQNIDTSHDGFQDFNKENDVIETNYTNISTTNNHKNKNYITLNKRKKILNVEEVLEMAKKAKNRNRNIGKHIEIRIPKNKLPKIKVVTLKVDLRKIMPKKMFPKMKPISLKKIDGKKMNSYNKLYSSQITKFGMTYLYGVRLKGNPSWDKPSFLIYKNRKPALFFTLQFLFYPNLNLVNDYYISNLSKGKLYATKDGIQPYKMNDYSEIGKNENRGTKLKIKDFRFKRFSEYEYEDLFIALRCKDVLLDELCHLVLSYIQEFIKISFYFKYNLLQNNFNNEKEISILVREQTSKRNILVSDRIEIPFIKKKVIIY